eukprot:3145314-Amphidinium_carterae.1
MYTEAPPCVRLHGLLPAPPDQLILQHEAAWLTGQGSTLPGLMDLAGIAATLTFAGVGLATALTLRSINPSGLLAIAKVSSLLYMAGIAT